MSKSNANNRPQASVSVGALSASLEHGLVVAYKKMRVHVASLMDVATVAASGSNYVTALLLHNGTPVGSGVDTQAGLAARTPLDLDLGAAGYLDLEAGDVLSCSLLVTGSGALTSGSLHADLEVIGN